jgi:hypothetical protein
MLLFVLAGAVVVAVAVSELRITLAERWGETLAGVGDGSKRDPRGAVMTAPFYNQKSSQVERGYKLRIVTDIITISLTHSLTLLIDGIDGIISCFGLVVRHYSLTHSLTSTLLVREALFAPRGLHH